MAPIVNTKNYAFKFYLGYQQYAISEEFISTRGNSLSSVIQFNSIQSSLHPINLTINIGDLRVYVGGGGYVNYNLSSSIILNPIDELNVREDLFTPLTYGVVGQIGIGFKKIGLELNGFNSSSDLISGEIEESISLIGLTAQLNYNF